MKVKIALPVFGLTIAFGCRGADESQSAVATLNVKNDQSEFVGRITHKNNQLEVVNDAASSLALAKEKSYTLTLIAEVEPPSIDGVTLQATDISLHGKRAYVSFNVAGSSQRGAVSIIKTNDLYEDDDEEENGDGEGGEDSEEDGDADTAQPTLESEILFPSEDVNAVKYKSNKVYIVGASTGPTPAYLRVLTIINGQKFTGAYSDYSLTSYAGTDVTVGGDKVYTTSGDEGGLKIFNKNTLQLEATIEIADARSVFAKSGKVTVLAGQPGTLYTFDNKAEKTADAVEIGGATISESKSTIDSSAGLLITALGDGGVKLICKKDDAVVGFVDAVTVDGLDPSLTVSNAATMDKGLLFVANGEAGVYLYSVSKGKKNASKCEDRSLAFEGSIDFGEDLSANHVLYKSKHLFVADGLGGLKIIRVGIRVFGDTRLFTDSGKIVNSRVSPKRLRGGPFLQWFQLPDGAQFDPPVGAKLTHPLARN